MKLKFVALLLILVVSSVSMAQVALTYWHGLKTDSLYVTGGATLDGPIEFTSDSIYFDSAWRTTWGSSSIATFDTITATKANITTITNTQLTGSYIICDSISIDTKITGGRLQIDPDITVNGSSTIDGGLDVGSSGGFVIVAIHSIGSFIAIITATDTFWVYPDST